MGLFSFLKGAGESLLNSAAENSVNAAKLVDVIQSNGFDVTDLDVEIDGDTAKVWGAASDQATREKVLLALGNTKGIANVEDNMTTAVPAPEAKFHTVQKGESLSLIAKKYYSDAMKYNDIFEANQPLLKDVNKIFPGQVLRIPNL
ncbi:MAG: peptidoglycan-binding protein LysM [Flavobacteriaceae bacterium]|nr:peptidoglycan-binding protein LysM [Flavobacteriaceae bacterium]